MEDQELLEVLEKAYAKGVPLDYIRTVTSDEQYKAAEEFFLKKKTLQENRRKKFFRFQNQDWFQILRNLFLLQ